MQLYIENLSIYYKYIVLYFFLIGFGMTKIPYNFFFYGKLNATITKELGTMLRFSEPKNIVDEFGELH